MTKITTIAVITGSRADYGLMQPVISALSSAPEFQLQIVVTAAHLSPEFGLTYREIEADGFSIDEKVEMLLSSDTGVGTAKATGLGTIGVADALSRLQPNCVMLLGDRFEALAAAQAALFLNIPVAHISGGDVTEGAFDDALRHAITKMSHLHFAASEESADRIVQMGEDPANVFAVGDPGLDSLRTMDLISKADLEKDLAFTFRKKNLLITFHPVTLAHESSPDQLQCLLDVLDVMGPDLGLIFTQSNADPETRELGNLLNQFVAGRENAVLYSSLGRRRYLSAMAICDAVVGNSSSGLLEAPSLCKPSVNIGNRQKGRLRANTVIDCGTESVEISSALKRALAMKCDAVANPYGDGHSADRIVKVLSGVKDYSALTQKRFRDLPVSKGDSSGRSAK